MTSHRQPPKPFFLQSDRYLSLESTIGELPLYQFQVDWSFAAEEIVPIFHQYPLLPGVVLLAEGEYVGMISRQRMMEFLMRAGGQELFWHKPLEIFYSYARSPVLLLSEHTPVVEAARQALRRSPELLGEPIVVRQDSGNNQLLNVHELNIAYWQIRGIETQTRFEHLQAQMIQNEKMASLGRLVDGVAHEILDPVGFIWGNLSHITNYIDILLEILNAYRQQFESEPEEVKELKEDVEFEFLQQDMPQAIASMKNGAERIKNLVTSLQNFCHIDEVYPRPADLHDSLESAILLLKSRSTIDIKIVRRYDNLPPVPCYIGQLSQVFMNILSNSVDALINQATSQKFSLEFQQSDRPQSCLLAYQKPTIEITTQLVPETSEKSPNNPRDKQLEKRWISIQIADNGPGISPEKQQEIFDSFSRKKKAGKETSLALSYWIVTAKHGGKFHFYSTPNQGTTFEIWLPRSGDI